MRTNNLSEYQDAVEYLKTSPMFNLSLSSNELFHSNFLYWISKSNEDMFKKIINGLVGDCNWWKDKCGEKELWKEIEVRREYKNFDLCIVEVIVDAHNKDDKQEDLDAGDYKTDGLILFVLENKVKSIPYAKQLENYNEKIKEHNNAILKKIIKKERGVVRWNQTYNQEFEERKESLSCSKVLLSLTDTFPDIKIENGEFKGWKRRSYCDYLELLQPVKIKGYKNVCEDYRNYITCLNTLVEEWNKDSYNYRKEEKKFLDWFKNSLKADELRLHALYHKYNYAKLCCELMTMLSEELPDELKNVQYIRAQDDSLLLTNEDKKKNGKFSTYNEYFGSYNTLIGIGYGYSNQSPILEIKIVWKEEDVKKRFIHIIQIQGNSYERGIVIKKSNVTHKLQTNVETWIHGLDNEDGNIFAEQSKVNRDKYNSYDGTFCMIYKYRKLNSEIKIKDLFSFIKDDVNSVLSQISCK